MYARNLDGYTVTQVAQKEYLTRQAVCLAIHKGSLRAKKFNGHWVINKSALKDWKKNKYSREKRVIDGKLLFSEGNIDVKRSAEIKKCSRQKIYYAIYKGYLKTQKLGNQHIIAIEDLENLVLEEVIISRKGRR